MAIYHLSAKLLSRSAGRSAVAAAAYRSGSKLRDERTAQEHDFTRKSGVAHDEIIAPHQAPAWVRDREQLWNAVERTERRRDAQLAREIEVALPRELSRNENIELLRSFVQAEFVDRGMVADLAVHEVNAKDGEQQPHAHVMLSTRELSAGGFGRKNREWNRTELLETWRARWADHVNAGLERAGKDGRVDHRSLEVQRTEAEREAKAAREAGDLQRAEHEEARAAALDREAEPKLGPTASQMEKLGHASRRGEHLREVKARNEQRRVLREQANEISKQIAEAARQLTKDLQRRLDAVARQLRAAYLAVRERAEATIRAERAGDEAPSNGVKPLTDAIRDKVFGRAERSPREPAHKVDREALLGRITRQADVTTREANIPLMLGRTSSDRTPIVGESSEEHER